MPQASPDYNLYVLKPNLESFEKQLIFLISRRVSNFSKMSTEISEKFTREWSAEA
jgi:hypothetical protein